MNEADFEQGQRFMAAVCEVTQRLTAKQAQQLKKKNGQAEFVCPICHGRAFVQRSSSDGYRRAYCQACGIRFIE